MNKVLVTGATGFIGRALIHELTRNGVKVIAIVRDKSNCDLPTEVNVISCNLDNVRELPSFVADRDIDCCIHLAWEGTTGKARANTNIQISNTSRSIELCNVLPELRIKRFIGTGSTAEIDAYNASNTDGVTPNPVSIYGIAKLFTHLSTKVLCGSLRIEHVWACVGNTFGANDKSDNFINFASKLIMSDNKAEFTSGEQNYDFVHVKDVAEGLCCIAEKGKDKSSYYIGSGAPRKLKEYIIALRDILNPDKELFLGAIPYNGVYSPLSVFDTSKTYEDTGFRAKIGFEDGVKMLPPPPDRPKTRLSD